MEKSYITDIERERCKKVAAAYAELYELESILVLDVGDVYKRQDKTVSCNDESNEKRVS